MSVQQEKFKIIADKIREKTGSKELIKPDDFAEKINDVYDSGKKSEYDEFWDNFQNYGRRTLYGYAFCSFETSLHWWNETIFKPKYDLKPVGSNDSMFRSMKIKDFPKHFQSLGIECDLSQVTSFNDGFFYTETDHIGSLNLSKCSSMNFAFFGCTAKTIDKLILKSGVSVSSAFNNAFQLENLTIEGQITNNGFNFQWSSKLTRESLISIINALSPDRSGLTITFSKTAVNNAFGIDIDDEATYPEGSEYYNLRNTKINWNFNYV